MSYLKPKKLPNLYKTDASQDINLQKIESALKRAPLKDKEVTERRVRFTLVEGHSFGLDPYSQNNHCDLIASATIRNLLTVKSNFIYISSDITPVHTAGREKEEGYILYFDPLIEITPYYCQFLWSPASNVLLNENLERGRGELEDFVEWENLYKAEIKSNGIFYSLASSTDNWESIPSVRLIFIHSASLKRYSSQHEKNI